MICSRFVRRVPGRGGHGRALAQWVASGLSILSLMGMLIFSLTVNAGDCSVVSNGLVACYPFDGNALDSSGNGNHGTVYGATLTTDRSGNANSAYLFNGSSYIEIADHPSLDLAEGFTISLWVRQDSNSIYGYRLIDKTTAGVNDGYNFDTYDGSTGHRMRLTAGQFNTSATVTHSLKEWHHLVVTFSNGTSNFYLDGIPNGSGYNGSVRVNNLTLKIGAAHFSNNENFRGTMDDVRIYNRALSQTEIQQLAGIQSPKCDGITSGLVLCLPLDGNPWDGSGNGNHGLVQSAVPTQDRFGNPNRAYKFDGGDYIQIPNSPSINIAGNITVSTWIRSSGTPGHTGLFHKQPLAGTGRVTGWQSSINTYEGNNWDMRVYHSWPSVMGRAPSPTKVVDGNWHHLAAVYNGQTITTYTDGIKDNSVAYTKGMLPNDRPLYIGVDPDVWGSVYWGPRNFQGDIDDVRIYNRALSEEEVQQLAGISVISTDSSMIISNWEYKMTIVPNLDPNVIEVPMQVTPKADGSYEGNNGKMRILLVKQPPAPSVREDADSKLHIEIGKALTADGQPSAIDITLKPNGSAVLSNSQDNILEPLTVNKDGKIVITDGSVQIIADADGNLIGTDADNPQIQVLVTPAGQIMVTDSSAPEIVVTANTDGSLTGKDTVSGTEVTLDEQGQQIVTHPDFPGMQATVNADGTLTVTDASDPEAMGIAAIFNMQTGNYQVVNTADGTCYDENSNLRKSFWKKVAGFVSKAAGFVATVATKVAPIAKVIGEVSGTINKVVSSLLGKAPGINDWAKKNCNCAFSLIAGIANFAFNITSANSGLMGFLGTAKTVTSVITAVAKAVPVVAQVAQKVSDFFKKLARDGDRPQVSTCTIWEPISAIRETDTCLLYGVQDRNLNDSIIFTVDPDSNQTLPLGSPCIGCDIEALDTHPMTGVLYAGSGDDARQYPNGHLYKLDTDTGELTSVGATGFDDISSLAFDKQDTLWAWAKGVGLVQLDVETGKGTVILASSVAIADLTWSADGTTLYGAVGTELWSYMPATNTVAKMCDNLPAKTEAIRVLPTAILPDGFLLIGAHKDKNLKLHAFDSRTCQLVVESDMVIPYGDVEGLALAPSCQ